MKERIQELALEARLSPALLLHHWGKVDALTDSEQEVLEQIEKFAELIVEECVAQCWTVSAIEHKGTVISECSKRMRKHFGVDV